METSQITQAVAKGTGCSPQPESRSLLLKTEATQGEVELVRTYSLYPCVLTVLDGALHITN